MILGIIDIRHSVVRVSAIKLRIIVLRVAVVYRVAPASTISKQFAPAIAKVRHGVSSRLTVSAQPHVWPYSADTPYRILDKLRLAVVARAPAEL